ncbi:hypothetical protein A5865_001403, partial [Enterococcus sp. 12E11_DIV0728]
MRNPLIVQITFQMKRNSDKYFT